MPGILTYDFFSFSIIPLFLSPFLRMHIVCIFEKPQEGLFIFILLALSSLIQRFSVRVKTALFDRHVTTTRGRKEESPWERVCLVFTFLSLNKSARAVIFVSKNRLKGATSSGFLPSLFQTVLKLRQRLPPIFFLDFKSPC